MWMTTKAMHYAAENDNEKERLRAVVHRAEILRSINSLEEAIHLLDENEEAIEAQPNNTVKSTYFNRKSAILFELKSTKEALEAVLRSKAIDAEKGFKWRILSNLNLEGAIYRDMGQFERAEKIYREVEESAMANGDTSEWLSALYNLNLTQFRRGKYIESIKTAKKYNALNHYEALYQMQSDNYHNIAMAFSALGQYDSAFHYLNIAHEMRLDDMQRIIDSRVDAFKIVSELENEKLKNQILESEKNESQYQLSAMGLVILLVIAIAIALFYGRERYRLAAKEQQARFEEMEATLTFKNKLISIVAHDIRNPVASVKGMIQLYHHGLVEEAEFRKWIESLEVSVGNVDLLLENLLNWVKSQSGDIVPYIEEVDIIQLVDKTISGLTTQAELKHISMNVHTSGNLHSIKADANILSFALRNIMSNALKFSPKNAEIKVVIEERNGKCELSVSDQGGGMKPEILDSLRKNKAVSTDGTHFEKGTGMGLPLSYEFLEAMGAVMDIESTEGVGTTIRISCP